MADIAEWDTSTAVAFHVVNETGDGSVADRVASFDSIVVPALLAACRSCCPSTLFVFWWIRQKWRLSEDGDDCLEVPGPKS